MTNQDPATQTPSDPLAWLYCRKLEQWHRAAIDQWEALIDSMRSLSEAARERGSVASGEWEFDRWFTQAHLFIICVRHVWRFATLLAEILDSKDVLAAVGRFEARVPHAKDVRDFLEHFDDYARGKGRRNLPRSEDLGTLINEPQNPIETLSYSFGGLELPLGEARDASVELATIVLELVCGHRSRTRREEGTDDRRSGSS